MKYEVTIKLKHKDYKGETIMPVVCVASVNTRSEAQVVIKGFEAHYNNQYRTVYHTIKREGEELWWRS